MSKTSTLNRDKTALNKRIVVCTGEKGGTGKSIVARFLLDMYLANGAIDLVMHFNGCNFRQALVWLHKRFDEAVAERAAIALDKLAWS